MASAARLRAVLRPATRSALLWCLLGGSGCTLALDFRPSALLPALDAGDDRPEPDAPATDLPPAETFDDALVPDVATTTDTVPADTVPADTVPADIGVDPPNCGGRGTGGEPCCAGSRCNAGYLCTTWGDGGGAACFRCGGIREPCCGGGFCGPGRACAAGVCR
ncbi:MAG: hypothetical protein JWM10_3078 [Myxococcaceae bacterium]|nr:hypothetical protein [Myxococcaceae bacterium]